MAESNFYWDELCALVTHLRCWTRIAVRTDSGTVLERWGQLLTMPTGGYLEAAGGPVPLESVEWVDVATRRVRGGIAGRPRQMIDIKDELLVALRATSLVWALRSDFWSLDGVFDEEPLELVRVQRAFSRSHE